MKNKRNLAIFIVAILLIFCGVIAIKFNSKYSAQKEEISSLKNQISSLEETQLPQKQFESYEDCINNGGVDLWTINIQLTGCLGGEAFPENNVGDDYVYQAQAFFQYSAQELPRLEESKTNDAGKNVIVDGAPISADLTQFLENDYAGCGDGSGDESEFAPAYYKPKKEVQNRFALLGYGCADDKLLDTTLSIWIKLADGWRGISTTNNMDEKGRPSCLVVDMFKISKELTPKCFENTGYNNGKLKDVVYP